MESELVSGFMTEHSSVVFVFFFLAEYASMVLMCILLSILFLGGYLVTDFLYLINKLQYWIDECWKFVLFYLENRVELIFNTSSFVDLICKYMWYGIIFILCVTLMILEALSNHLEETFTYIYDNPGLERLLFGIIIGFKSSILIFIFICVRASYPRVRFDELMSYCWTHTLPITFAFIIFVPCVLYGMDIYPMNVFTLTAFPLVRANLSYPTIIQAKS